MENHVSSFRTFLFNRIYESHKPLIFGLEVETLETLINSRFMGWLFSQNFRKLPTIN